HRWKPPQTATLTLPSGHLRLETADSFSLGPDLPDDDALLIAVPAGEYLLTLVEAEDGRVPPGRALRDTPRVLLTLTPTVESAESRAGGLVRCRTVPPPPPPLAKHGDRWSIEADAFNGLLTPDGTMVNLKVSAAHRLELEFGDVLEIECVG